jgi:hypothetical protein
MMTPDQYHLCKIAEECAEVAQRALKAQQFGLDETQAGQPLNNLDRLVGEFHDLFITFDNFLRAVDSEIATTPSAQATATRLDKMNKYLNLAKSLGQVDDEASVLAPQSATR